MIIDYQELWAYRELLAFLVARDLKVKYKQTAIGIAWAVLQPLVKMFVFTFIFGRFVKVPSGDAPYAMFSYTALILWTYFETSLTFSSSSLVANAPLLSKVYVPRIMLPVSSCLAAVIDLLISAGLLVVLMLYYQIAPTWRVFFAVPAIALTMSTALGCGLLLSAVNVKFRDVQYAVPFLIQIALFLTPVVYPSSLVPSEYRLLYGLNPMVAAVEGFRWAILPESVFPEISMMALSIAVSFAMLLGGMFYFARMERQFADLV